MSVKVSIGITPYGVDSDYYEIYELQAENTGVVEDLGFGHQICSYDYRILKPESLYRNSRVEYEGTISRHDRRDGVLSLLSKIIQDTGVDK